MTVKLIAVDLDGTLLRSDSSVCPKAIEKLQEAVNRGIHVVIATARRLQTVRPIAKELGITNQPIICADGALIMTALEGEIWQLKTVPQEITLAIAQAGDTNNWEMTFGTFERTYYRQRQGQALGHWRDEIYVFESYQAMPQADEQIRIYATDENSNSGIVALLSHEQYRDKITIQAYHNPDGTVESVCIYPPASSKGKGLAYVAEKLGIPLEETLAIGDGSNDITMFDLAGKSVAMGNARDAIKAYADCVTSSNDEAGVAHAVERYVLESV